MTKPNYLVNLSLLSNGLDFINCGLNELKEYEEDSDNVRIKYAVLHIHAGVELLLKERLRREHWSLVFDNEPSKAKYESGDFQSVGMTKCIDRLKTICDVPLSSREERRFKELREARNTIEHFNASYNVKALNAKIADALSSMIDFINTHLDPDDFQESDQDLFDEIKQSLSELTLYINQRMNDIRQRLAEIGSEVLTCPVCNQRAATFSEDLNCLFCGHKHPGLRQEISSATTVVVGCPKCKQEAAVTGDGLQCLFCGYEINDPETAADEYLSDYIGLSHYACAKDGEEWPQYECPSCSAEALVRTHEGNVCFSCGEEFNNDTLTYCTCCGQLISRYRDISICDDCLDYKVNKND